MTFHDSLHPNKRKRPRMPKRRRRIKCATCNVDERRPGQATCKACHAAYMREWRKHHPMTPEQRRKDNCRTYARVYRDRGKLQRQPCKDCGDPNTEMHHHDYDKPLDVTWLCRPCHLARHREDA